MDDSRDDTLKQLLRLSEENNRMLKALRSSMRLGHFFSVLKLIVLVAVLVGGFYFVEPYVAKAINIATDGKADGNAISASWQNFMSNLSHSL